MQLVERSYRQKIVFVEGITFFEDGKSVFSLQKLNSMGLDVSKLNTSISNRRLDL
jgi:hypothetical protein